VDALAALRTPRTEDCPSDLTLSELEAELLSADEQLKIRAHVDRCERCRLWLADGRAAFEAIANKDGPAIVAAMHGVAAKPRARFGARAGGLAAAAAIFVAFLLLQKEPPETTLKGGGLGLKIYRERAGKTSEVGSGAALFPKDRLRFEVDLPKKSQVMIIGVEETGEVYRCFPSASDASVELAAGPHQLLPDAIELDDSIGQEWVHLVACGSPFTAEQLRRTKDKIEPPDGCQTRSIRVHKSAP
jgi:hypothetical protein